MSRMSVLEEQHEAKIMRDYTHAKMAYDAYCSCRGWKSISGDKLPQFEAQSKDLQDAWWEAANAVRRQSYLDAAKLIRRAECSELTPGSIRLAWSKRLEEAAGGAA